MMRHFNLVYKKKQSYVANPTHDRGWMVQILSEVRLLEIEPNLTTAVGGCFRSLLEVRLLEIEPNPATAVGGWFRSFLEVRLLEIEPNPTHGSGWMLQIPSRGALAGN